MVPPFLDPLPGGHKVVAFAEVDDPAPLSNGVVGGFERDALLRLQAPDQLDGSGATALGQRPPGMQLRRLARGLWPPEPGGIPARFADGIRCPAELSCWPQPS